MRPKKMILNVDSNADRRGVLSFCLSVWGYRVLTADAAEEALAIVERRRHMFAIRREELDLMVVRHAAEKPDALQLVHEVKQRYPGVPCLVVSDRLTAPYGVEADVFLPRNCQRGSVVREQVGLLTACKRGPKPRLNPGAQAAADHAPVGVGKPPRSVADALPERLRA